MIFQMSYNDSYNAQAFHGQPREPSECSFRGRRGRGSRGAKKGNPKKKDTEEEEAYE